MGFSNTFGSLVGKQPDNSGPGILNSILSQAQNNIKSSVQNSSPNDYLNIDTGKSGLIQEAIKAAPAIMAMFSDENVKENIEEIPEDEMKKIEKVYYDVEKRRMKHNKGDK